MQSDHHLPKALLLFFILITISTIGFSLLLATSFLEAAKVTLFAITTFGYNQLSELNNLSKFFAVFITFASIALAGNIVINLVDFILQSNTLDNWRSKHMDKKIANMKDHYIICGAGETGKSVIAQFEADKEPFLIVDNRKERVLELRKQGILAIEGEPTSELALMQAQITKAKGLITALTSDSANIYVVLTARYLNKDLFIVSRAIEPHAHEKLTMAGANRTVSPNAIGGRRMAAMMTKPSIFSFLDVITYAGEDALNLEEVKVNAGSQLLGQSLKEAKIPEKTGLIIMSLKKNGSGAMIFNPGPDEKIELNDSMIVIGDAVKIKSLFEIAAPANN